MIELRLSTDDLDVFFDEHHHELAAHLRSVLPNAALTGDAAAVAARMGEELGLYRYLIPEARGGACVGRPDDTAYVDVRSLVLIREALGQVSPLADAIFAVQGLGSYPIALSGTEQQCADLLPGVISGQRITGFGLTEPEAGSDVASMQTRARRDGDAFTLDGEKILISNVPIAKHYVVFANENPELGRKGISAFIVEHDAPGLSVEPMPLSIPHPIGRIHLKECRIPASAKLGDLGRGFGLAMKTLDAFRISVGAAACGMASHALSLTLKHVASRKQFGKALADQSIVQGYVADMATELDASRLLVVRAAHKRDHAEPGQRVTVEAAMGKMYATEAAQRIIDLAVQLHGGMGVVSTSEVEALYREIRPLRIYEGATEIQKVIIARGLLG